VKAILTDELLDTLGDYYRYYVRQRYTVDFSLFVELYVTGAWKQFISGVTANV